MRSLHAPPPALRRAARLMLPLCVLGLFFALDPQPGGDEAGTLVGAPGRGGFALATAFAEPAPPPPPPPPMPRSRRVPAAAVPASGPRPAVPAPPPPPPPGRSQPRAAPATAGSAPPARAAPVGRSPPPPPPPPAPRARRAGTAAPPVPAQPRSSQPRSNLPRAGQPAPPPIPVAPRSARGADPLAGDEDEDEAGSGELGEEGDDLPMIVRIEFEGNLLYATVMMKSRLRNREGKRFDPAAHDADMRELYRYFRDIKVFKEPVAGGIVLRFRVSENPLVVKVLIRGNAEMDAAEVRQIMRTQEGFPLSPYHLAADREDVIEAYRMRGYHFADVPEPQVITLPNGGRQVTFAIVEGPQVQVQRILFRGNINLERKDLVEVMLTEQPNFFEKIIGDLVFREEVLREDLVAIKQLYRSEGFLDVEVALDDMRFSDDKSMVEIAIVIDEHQPYTVGNITFEIEREEPGRIASPTAEDIAYFTEERLRGLFGLRTGCRFSGTSAEEGVEKIQEEYFKRSYLDAAVLSPALRGREKALIVDLEITVREGPKFRLARIDFVGNEYTRDKILRREVKTAPGGYVDRNQLDRGLTRINRTGYFDRATMDIHDALDPDGEPIEGWKQATYELVEGSTGRVTFGVSLSTNGGFGAQIEFRKQNFDIARWPRSFDDISSGRAWTGAGQEFEILLSPSTQVTQFRVRFREPHLFGSEFSFETSLYKQFEFRETYTVDRVGYTLGLGHPLYMNKDETVGIFARATWRHEWDDITDIGFDSVPGVFLFRGSHELRSLSASVSMGTSNTFKDPTHTTSTSLSAELAGTFLGGDLDFWTASLQHTQSLIVHIDDEGKKQRLSGRLTCAIGQALEDTPELPPYERFYAGGRTFRGFRFRGVGPHVNGNPTGGEWMLGGSLEYEFPLVRKMLGIVVFTDAGTLGTSIGEPDAFLWRLSVGAGVRFAIPFLLGDQPLALDFGFPLFYEDVDEKTVVSFSMGRSF